jgi:hypothetical protein
MSKLERVREVVKGPLDAEYVRQRTDNGWKLIAVEWERMTEENKPEASLTAEDIPYGSRVAMGGAQLEESPEEMNALTLILELIVQDRSLSSMADTLNNLGFRTREGSKWTVVNVYNMLPRLIEVSPRIFTKESWIERRKQIPVGR